MSSTASKQSADQNSAGEPASKKVKIVADDATNTTSDNNSADLAKDSNSSVADKGTPIKAANGKTKGADELKEQPKQDNSKSNYAPDLDDDDDDDDDDDEGQPDPRISQFLEDIGAIQNEIGALNEKASEEILKVEQKFIKLRKPFYEKRNELLKNIPHFWIQTLYNHPNIAPMVDSDEDEDCLRYLVDLDVEEFEDIKSGYKIKLRFAENPYFKNETIVKEFHMISGGEQVAASTPLEYKDTEEGTSLRDTVKNETEIYNNMQNHQAIPRSFFAWFLGPVDSGTDEVAEIIKDQIWPNPLDYYQAEEPNDSDDDDDDDDESDDEELDEDDDGQVFAEGEEICEELDDDVDEELIEEIGDEEDDEDDS